MPSFSTPHGVAGLRAGLHAEVAGGFRTDAMLNINYQFELIKVISLHLSHHKEFLLYDSLNLRMDRLIRKGGKASGISGSI